MLGKHLIKSWSSTQTTVSLSSGEAEFYGVVKAAGIGLGYQALLEDLGYKMPVRVWTDSSATMGICTRTGLGKLRHIDTNCLWIQAKVRSGAIELRKVRGEVNPADLFTKYLSSNDRVRDLLNLFGCEYVEGRSELAPKLREGAGIEDSILALQKEQYSEGEVIEVDGIAYPKVFDEYNSQWVPEAYYHDEKKLPHQHDGVDKMFPRAVAVDPIPETAEAADHLEERGRTIGISAAAVCV